MPTHNTINYIELPTTDIPATKEFYSKLFGWSFTDWGEHYISFGGAGISGGFDASGETKPTDDGPKVILYSDDLQATRDAIQKAGGIITKDIYSFPGGKRFYFTDPSSNQLAVWGQ